MSVTYAWNGSRSFKVSAQLVGETLEAIEKRHGKVTPAVVVAQAREEASPLHSFFEWDDSKAAEQWRHQEARSLIGAIVVKTFDGEEIKNPTRAFVSVSATEGRSYVGIVAAMSDAEMRAQVLAKAQQEIKEWRNRYRALHEFSKVFQAIDELAAHEPSRRQANAAAPAGLG